MKIKLNLLVIVFSIIAIAGFTTKVSAQLKGAKVFKAHCFCKASWDLGGNPSTINPSFIDWGELKEYSGLNPQKEENQRDCRDVCANQAASDPRFTQEWWCANIIAEDKKPYSGKMIAYSAVGTKEYRVALEREVSCPKKDSNGGTTGGWQTAGFVAPDNAMKERCSRLTKAVVQTKASNPSLSPRATQLTNAKNWSLAGYNSSLPDRVFLDSFNLRNCKVCYAEMLMRVRAINGATGDGNAGNDAFHILGIPNANAPDFGSSPPMQYFRIWQSPTPGPNMPASAGTSKSFTFQIPSNLLNQYIFQTGPNTPLDVLVQDDSAVEAIQLRVWYY